MTSRARRWRHGAALLAVSGVLGCSDAVVEPPAQAAPPQEPRIAGARHAVVTLAKVQSPGGSRSVFRGRILVAYYGTAGTGSLGVLGEAPPDQITQRLRKAARPFGQTGRKVQIVYELIVTIADGSAGSDGDYSHDIPRSAVEKYVRAARRNHALLVLDLQPGRSTFPSVAKRWAWALRKPYVGLALDPEWRMRPHEVPGQTIGSVRAREVNTTSSWLARLTRRNDLPQKVFMVHQFRTDMVEHIGRIKDRRGLAMTQHVDGFGTQAQKRATYHNVERHKQFHMGFKLFYDEDTDLFRPRQVLRLRPRVEYVSYQ